MEDGAEIRRLHQAEEMPIKAIARMLGLSRNTVRAALASGGPPKYERKPARVGRGCGRAADPGAFELDVIGSYLIEVNVTSVGALRKADALLGWTLCADLIDSVLGAQARRSA